MKKVYDFYQDAGHGWAKVKLSELIELKIHLAISGFSYSRGEYVYLEEDCDLTKFCIAKRKIHGVGVQLRSHHTNRESRIRGYNSYTPYALIPKPTTFLETRETALLWWRSIDGLNKREALKDHPNYKSVKFEKNLSISSIVIHRLFCYNFDID